MPTIILSNGSKYAGQAPDPLEKLFEVFEQTPLDPTFERYGDFAQRVKGELAEHYGVNPDRAMLFWGNFYELSHGFNIYTDEPETIVKLLAAIQENKKTEAYAAARRVRRGQDNERAARDPAFRAFLEKEARHAHR